MDGHAQPHPYAQQGLVWAHHQHPQPPASPQQQPAPSSSSLKRPRSPPPAMAMQGGQGGEDGDVDAEGEPDIQLPQPPPELLFHHHHHHHLALPLPLPPPLHHQQQLDQHQHQHQHQLPHQYQAQQLPLLVHPDPALVDHKPIATNSRIQLAQAQAQAGPAPPAGAVGGSGDQQQGQAQQGSEGASVGVDGTAMPDRVEYDQQVDGYVQGLHPIKRNKALMSPSLHQMVLNILLDPHNTKQGDPQLRFWVRQRFTLQSSPEGDFVMHEQKKVVLRPNLFDTIAAAHAETGHGGRDKTYAAVKQTWSYVPKEVVTVFVKICPTCNGKRVTVKGKRPKTEKRLPLPKDILNGPSDDGVPDAAAPAQPPKRSGRKSAQAALAGISALAAQEQEDEDAEYRVRKEDHGVKEGEEGSSSEDEDGDEPEDAEGEEDAGAEGTDEDAPGEPDDAVDASAAALPPFDDGGLGGAGGIPVHAYGVPSGGIPVEGSVGAAMFDAAQKSAQALQALYRSE